MGKGYSIYIGAVVVVALGCAGYFLFQKGSIPDATSSVFKAPGDASTTISIASGHVQPPPHSKEYQNARYHFSLYYPDDLTVSEEPVGADGLVVLFKNTTTQQGFQIFTTAYDEPQITQSRFNTDEPSGVMQDPQNITIDGAAATEFFSTNQAMGASREIWFLRDGLLYEVTAPQSLDSWLLQIMQTWEFSDSSAQSQ
jgi:hypothetical protein